MNTAESAAVNESLIKAGWQAAEKPDNADLIIINTCSVRKTAENRIWGRLGFYKRLKKQNNFKLIVIGCMAERLKDSIKKEFSVVDSVVSNFKKIRIADLLDSSLDPIAAVHDNPDETYEFFDTHGHVSKTHSMIPIMNGCDNFCSYCIVPYVRGHEISREDSSIIKEIAELGKSGISEITLLGQNVNSYSYSDADFSDLLIRILAETDIKWLRFTSSNPQDFTDKLVDTIGENSRICNFIHLPAQHGSNSVLKRMRRKYSVEEYLRIAEKLKNIDGMSLSTDLMVGFPGETDDDFRMLIDLMKTVRFEEAFTYYYNPREGTEAYNFNDDVPHELKLERLSEVIELHRKIAFEEKSKRLGLTVEAVNENVSKKAGNEILARTERNSMVVYPGCITESEDYVRIKLKELKGNTFIGEAVNV